MKFKLSRSKMRVINSWDALQLTISQDCQERESTGQYGSLNFARIMYIDTSKDVYITCYYNISEDEKYFIAFNVFS